MGAGLYGQDAALTAAMDDFFASPGHAGDRLKDWWLSEHPGPSFDDASCAQPLLYAVGHALAAAVVARGVRPDALLGHSVGELTAAAVSGVFDPRDAGRIMEARSRAMSRTVPGGMLVVAGGADALAPFLTDSVVVAAINTPRQTALSGPTADLAATAASLTASGFACQPAAARQAFHSPACDVAADDFATVFEQVELAPPRIVIQSTRTGRPVTDAEALDPHFWAGQLARPVQFWAAFDALAQERPFTFLEAGPGGSCSAMTRRHPAVRAGRSVVLPLLPATGSDPRGSLTVLDAALAALAARAA